MPEDIVMGIDIGTSGCKTILVDAKGRVAARETESYPLFSPRHGWNEQSPADWWQAVKLTVQRIASSNTEYIKKLKCIGLTGQMHGLVALDKNMEVIRPGILWNDQRTGKQCQQVHHMLGGIDRLLEYTNNRMLPGYTGGKILWVRENEPCNYEKIKKFVNPKDYIRYRLTGEIATEVSDASGTGLFDVKRRTWSRNLMEKLEIPPEWVPECYESTRITGKVTRTIAGELGLPGQVPVAGGGGDSVIQTLGTGVITSTVLMTTIGTAGIISTAFEDFRENPEGKLQVFCNVMPGTWHAMGVTLAAGGSMEWTKQTLGHSEKEVARMIGEDTHATISREAENSPPGSRGVIFLPYLTGERCPHTDPHARGAFIGLSMNTIKNDLFRSVMEGVIFSFRDVAELFNQIGMSFEYIATSGGGAQSNLWRQVHADIFKNKVITVSGSREGAAYGAVVVAGVGSGVWSDFKEASSLLTVETVNEPNPSTYPLYDHYYNIYRGFYPLLKNSFKAIGKY
ncbi:MAG: xylulokinase [Spirochaetota bacterium]